MPCLTTRASLSGRRGRRRGAARAARRRSRDPLGERREREPLLNETAPRVGAAGEALAELERLDVVLARVDEVLDVIGLADRVALSVELDMDDTSTLPPNTVPALRAALAARPGRIPGSCCARCGGSPIRCAVP